MTKRIESGESGEQPIYVYGLVLGMVQDPNEAMNISESLSKIERVGLAQATTGPFDFIALIRGSRPSEIGDIVVKKIQAIPGVRGTMTEIIGEDSLTPRNWLQKEIDSYNNPNSI